MDDLRSAVIAFEKRHIERILSETPEKREAARRLGVGLATLYRRIKELGIDAPHTCQACERAGAHP